MYLLDTNVVSELSKAPSGKADPNVVAWASSVLPEALYLSAITVLELETGVLAMERRDAAQGAALRHWLESRVMRTFEGRILPFDTAAALKCAELHVPDKRAERDAMIAATAFTQRLTVVTRNAADFDVVGLAVFNPWVSKG